LPVFFAFPLCLIGLIPWAAVAVYALQGRRRRVAVPFLELWPRGGIQPRSRRRREVPPFVALVLTASFLAILAAAGPQIRRRVTARPVVLIVDRGFTMSARQGSARRFQALAADAAPIISPVLGPGPARLITIPGRPEQIVERTQFPVEPAPTAVDTRAAVVDAVRKALQDPQAIVILLSDQEIGVANDRLVQIVPTQAIQNIGIAALSVRATPVPQAMVRILNDSPLRAATLTVTSASPVSVALPNKGDIHNYFIDLTDAPPVVEAGIDPGGDIDADDHAWAARQAGYPHLELRGRLPAELERMVDVYQHDRPANADSMTVALVNGDLGPEEPGVVISSDFTEVPRGDVQWTAGPMTQGIDWSAAVRDAQISVAQPGAGWNRLVWIGDRTLLAARPGQLWIGFRSAHWAATTDFVLFWARAFDSLGAGGGGYVYKTVGPADVPLWPGMYGKVAVNAPAIQLHPAAPRDWRSQLAALARAQTAGGTALGTWMLLMALVCLLFAAGESEWNDVRH
jgi:hypothetical protein